MRVVFGTQSAGGQGDGIISWPVRLEREAVEHYLAALCVQDIVPGEERGAEGGDPRRAERVYVREPRAGEEVVLRARKPLPTVSVEVARGEPTRDGDIEHDVPDARPFCVCVSSVLVAALVAEFYSRFRDQLFGYAAEADGGVGCFLCDELGLSLERDDERAEKNADGASSVEEGVRTDQGKGYVAGKGIGGSVTRIWTTLR